MIFLIIFISVINSSIQALSTCLCYHKQSSKIKVLLLLRMWKKRSQDCECRKTRRVTRVTRNEHRPILDAWQMSRSFFQKITKAEFMFQISNTHINAYIFVYRKKNQMLTSFLFSLDYCKPGVPMITFRCP